MAGGARGDRLPRPGRRAGLVDSPAYQEILPLRTRNADGVTLLVDGVPAGYRAASYAEKLGGQVQRARPAARPGR